METLANGYSSESTPRELSNEYQHDWVWMVIKNLCIFVLWIKVASALDRLKELWTRLILLLSENLIISFARMYAYPVGNQ